MGLFSRGGIHTNNSISVTEKYLNALGLKPDKDPFPKEPPDIVDYWADNREVYDKIMEIKGSLSLFISTRFYIFWGPVGIGKTFAARYFENIMKDSKFIYVKSVIPFKTGQLVKTLYKNIVQECFNEILTDREILLSMESYIEDLNPGKIKNAFLDINKKVYLDVEGKSVSRKVIENSEGFKLLTYQKSKLGVIEDINEMVETIKFLFDLIKIKYERIMLFIDELENLGRSSAIEKLLVSDLLRKIHGEINTNLAVFLIFTYESFQEIEKDLQRALLERIDDIIEFKYITNKRDIIEYITDCIRERGGVNPDEIIDKKVIEEIANELAKKKDITFRTINWEMHNIFRRLYIISGEKPFKITYELWERYKKQKIS